MKKQKPIKLSRKAIRKSVRKPMPPPGHRHEDERDKKLGDEPKPRPEDPATWE